MKKSLAEIQQLEERFHNLLFAKDFEDVFVLVREPIADFGLAPGIFKTTAEKAGWLARRLVDDLLASSSPGQINESEMGFAREKVPGERSHHDAWIDWYNDELLPNRNKVVVGAGGEAVGEIEYDEKQNRMVRKKKKVAKRSSGESTMKKKGRKKINQDNYVLDEGLRDVYLKSFAKSNRDKYEWLTYAKACQASKNCANFKSRWI